MLKYILLVIIFVVRGNGEECSLGKYGANCDKTCNPNCATFLDKSVHCHKLTGKCSGGCKSGWHGDQCNHRCSKNCLNNVCNVQTGTCINCDVNYSGDYCETSREKQKSTPLAAILAPMIAIILILIIIIIIFIIIFIRRSKRALDGETANADEALDGETANADEGDNLIDSRNTTAVDTSPGVATDSHLLTQDTDFHTPDTVLHAACKEGKLQKVRDILEQSPEDINKKDCSGMTPVMWAARRGHREVLDLLLKKEADVSLKDKDGHNILYWACYGRNFAMVKYVLSLDKVDIHNTGLDGRTPAMFTAQQGYMKLFDLLVSKGGLPSEVDNEGNNILLMACCGGNVEIVKYIISHKTVDINSGGQSNRTPLMVAAYRGNEEVVDLLVKKGANPKLVGDAGDNVLHSACQGGHVDIVKCVVDLVDKNSPGQYKRTPLMMAARRGEKEIFDLLVGKKAASFVDDDGNSILHLASEGGHLEIVKFVLENMDISDINARNKHNETATMLAPRGGEVSHLLVSGYHGLMQ